ncbi:hypothetical protein MPH61_23435 [Peribacillus muralis]|uniref:hypothetical protein n=1 Tax=Peribacillus muralis TaxID=264697 RepID=UPI001F4E0CA7|nr:hypothetical protein [Peribacillus muralis]MCK1995479.1 hypothetical protein [Peribacillus muralis]MCK2016062.1 hypothetical protein [Peribacillus muralis]
MELEIEMLDLSEIDDRISHLSEIDIIQMITKYYGGTSVTQLKSDYQIQITASQFIKVFPKKISNNHCQFCNINLVEEWKSKTNFSIRGKFPYCPHCKHENHDRCQCETCEGSRRDLIIQEEKRKRALINEHYNEINYSKVPEAKLSLEDKLYLSVLLRGGLDENLFNINPVSSLEQKLTPTENFTVELIKTLTVRNLIVPCSASSINAFVDNESFPTSYYVDRVIFRVNIEPNDDFYPNMIQRLLYPDQKEFEKNSNFCFEMWRKISLNESLQYLLYSLEKVGFDFSPGEKTISVFEHLLEHYSVAQVYNIIYRAVANSTKLYQERKMSKKHAANTVISTCESYGERAIAEGWSLTKYRRNYDLPETLISSIFFTSILKIAYLGFEEKPTSNI